MSAYIHWDAAYFKTFLQEVARVLFFVDQREHPGLRIDPRFGRDLRDLANKLNAILDHIEDDGGENCAAEDEEDEDRRYCPAFQDPPRPCPLPHERCQQEHVHHAREEDDDDEGGEA